MSSHDYNRYKLAVPGGDLSVGVWEPGPTEPGRVPTVCVIHGITSNHLFFAGLVAALPGIRVIGPDLRGRADSHHLAGPYGMRVHAEDVRRAVEEFADPGPVTLVGHSMGGFVAMTLAAADDAGDRFRGPVLIDGGLPLPIPDAEDSAGRSIHPLDDLNDVDLDTDDLIAAVLGPAAERLSMEFDTVEDYLAYFAAHPAFVEGLDPVAAESFVYDLAAKDDHRFQPSTPVEAMQADSADMYTGADYRDALERVMAERQEDVTFLVAERDLLASEPGIYPPSLLETYRRTWPRMDIVEVPGTNHYDILLSPVGIDACAEAVLGTLPPAE
ncbi:pimeloyl-ACP methyl ester carboxylesterase [Brevibacterium sanguinis]|uniref:Pimeloyl-ACP methyl ester carboxylesterase n=2 Tax=Brevibacterium TaxID=1696 RepID=A0A366IHK4_9MICO|nr:MULTISPECIES: alpha/beta hydrolase [Brevibacterium]RBP63671.1 pimeloyl-ACP methyl ester carboxylesterase [Brevibacterium sanguinis]RBP70330.1 pimeloyl-ACP methyl ester carboxylesterase [Brevibacterium celere]